MAGPGGPFPSGRDDPGDVLAAHRTFQLDFRSGYRTVVVCGTGRDPATCYDDDICAASYLVPGSVF